MEVLCVEMPVFGKLCFKMAAVENSMVFSSHIP